MGVRVLETLTDYKHPPGLRHGCVGEQEAWCLGYADRLFISCSFQTQASQDWQEEHAYGS